MKPLVDLEDTPSATRRRTGAVRPGQKRGNEHTAAKAAPALQFTTECLAGTTLEPTLILDGDGAHRLRRLFRDSELARLAPESAHRGLDLLRRVTQEGRANEANLVGTDGAPAFCRPVFGPTDAVYGHRTTVGATDKPDEVIPLIPLEFDSARLAHFGEPDGPAPAWFDTDTTWTLPALLEHVVRLDKRLDLIAMFDPIEPADRWCESLVLDDPATKTRRHLWMAARAAINDDGERVVRSLIADITAISPPPDPDPVVEHLAARAARGHGAALMDVRTTLMHSFCCDGDPRMDPWRNSNPELHPADMPAVLNMLADLANNRQTRLCLRVRFNNAEPWTTLRGNAEPLPNRSRPQASIDFWIEDDPDQK